MGVLFAFGSLIPRTDLASPTVSGIDFRVEDWAEVSINGLPFFYVPKKIVNLRPGRYQVRWRKKSHFLERQIALQAGELFLLKLETSEL